MRENQLEKKGEPRIQAQLVTSDYRGDHAADVRIALAVDDPHETLAAFLARVGWPGEKEHIELRIVRGGQ